MHSRLFSLLLCLSLPAIAADKPSPTSIDKLVTTTLAANPELKFYEAEIHAAKAGRRIAGKLPNPELSLDVGRMRVAGSDATAEGLAYAATLVQPIEWPGRLGLRKAIANGDIILAELGLARFQSYLTGRVRVLGFALSMQQQKAEAAAEVATVDGGAPSASRWQSLHLRTLKSCCIIFSISSCDSVLLSLSPRWS